MADHENYSAEVRRDVFRLSLSRYRDSLRDLRIRSDHIADHYGLLDIIDERQDIVLGMRSCIIEHMSLSTIPKHLIIPELWSDRLVVHMKQLSLDDLRHLLVDKLLTDQKHITRAVGGLPQYVAFVEQGVPDVRTSAPVSSPRREEREPPAVLPHNNDSVFIVHGHDGEAKHHVARVIAQLGLTPIILHEQPDLNRTIIEKLEAQGSPAFVVVLLTPDDVGGKTQEALVGRARQNVILELGYFIGKLGRQRVRLLLKSGLERPSDLDGVLYGPMDADGAWKLKLVHELRAAGIDVDANKLTGG